MSFAIITPIWKKRANRKREALGKITSAADAVVGKRFCWLRNVDCINRISQTKKASGHPHFLSRKISGLVKGEHNE